MLSDVGRTLLGLSLAIVAASVCAGDSRQNAAPYGIWTRGETVVLFAHVYPCPPDELPPPGAAQLFVSEDGGKSWGKRGPQLDGSVFEYIYEAKGRVWIVGEHTAEGPASEPFILVPDESGLGWSVHVIYEDAAELESIVVQNNGDFGAWIRHLKLHDNGWTGPLYLHKSSDGGRTWRLVGRTNNAPANQAAGFKKIETQTATWRVADQGNGVSVVERRTDEHSAWKTVYRFPPNVCGP